MNKFRGLVMAAVLAMSGTLMTGCSGTGTSGESSGPVIQNPATAGIVGSLTDFAFAQAEQYVNNWLFGPRKAGAAKAPSVEFKIQQTVVAAQTKFPDLPRTKIEAVVRTQYKKALDAKRSGSG